MKKLVFTMLISTFLISPAFAEYNPEARKKILTDSINTVNTAIEQRTAKIEELRNEVDELYRKRLLIEGGYLEADEASKGWPKKEEEKSKVEISPIEPIKENNEN